MGTETTLGDGTKIEQDVIAGEIEVQNPQHVQYGGQHRATPKVLDANTSVG